jgi:hypothetical protein
MEWPSTIFESWTRECVAEEPHSDWSLTDKDMSTAKLFGQEMIGFISYHVHLKSPTAPSLARKFQ